MGCKNYHSQMDEGGLKTKLPLTANNKVLWQLQWRVGLFIVEFMEYLLLSDEASKAKWKKHVHPDYRW